MKSVNLARFGLESWDITVLFRSSIRGKKVSITNGSIFENVELFQKVKMERESCCGLTNLEGLLLDPINDILDAPICIGGMTSLTTIDFPGRLAAVVFCQGCPWRCRYCHNPHLQSFESAGPQIQKNWNDFLKFLEARVGLLDGIVFSGGEPTFQKNLG